MNESINIINAPLPEHIEEYDVILVGTNLNHNMGNGFQRYLRLYYPYVFEQNMTTRYGDIKKLGTIFACKEENKPIFILCFISEGVNYRPDIKSDYLSYESLEKCLNLVNILYGDKELKIASTIMGNSRFDGNGDKGKILEIFRKTLTNIKIDLYDYYQESKEEYLLRILKEESKVKEKDRKKYYEMVRKRKEEAEERLRINKRARY